MLTALMDNPPSFRGTGSSNRESAEYGELLRDGRAFFPFSSEISIGTHSYFIYETAH